MVGTVVVQLGKSSGMAMRLGRARVRDSVSFQKSGRETSLYRDFSPHNS
jgi:hypothetical protein